MTAHVSRSVREQSQARVDHHAHWKSRTKPSPSSAAVWIFLCAEEAGCGWLCPADARFVTQTGAQGCLGSQPPGCLNRLPSLEMRSKYDGDDDAENDVTCCKQYNTTLSWLTITFDGNHTLLLMYMIPQSELNCYNTLLNYA